MTDTDNYSDKASLRFEALRHRNTISLYDEDPEKAADNFFKCSGDPGDKIVALYWPKEREFDVTPLIMRLLENGVTCCLPVTEKDTRVLAFARWDETIPLVHGTYNVQHPVLNDDTRWVDPDIIVVPMLAFDRYGNRLGYGGGYYDATLADLRARKPVTAIGIAYAGQACLFALPSEDHDEKLDYIITPQNIYDFTQ
jgi:5-formyltetrahydrofolate cyclo-ligase